MKTKTKIGALATIVAGLCFALTTKAQTYGSGNVGNGCTPAAGAAAVGSAFYGCGAGANDCGNYNTWIGELSGNSNKFREHNVGLGYKTLFNLTNSTPCPGHDSTFNIAIGNWALYNTNPSSTSNGRYNTVIGHKAGYYNVTGTDNAILGYNAGGLGAAATNSFSNCTFVGSQAGYSHKTGNHVTFIGYQAGYSNTTAADNTYAGYQSGYTNATATGNAFFGDLSGFNNAGAGNTFVGHNSGNGNSGGANNVAVGLASFYNSPNGSNNTVVGYGAGQGVAANSYSDNSFFGYKAGNAMKTGTASTFLGREAGYNITASSNNTICGYQAGFNNQTGANNCITGYQAGYGLSGTGNSDYSSCVFDGYLAGYSDKTAGAENTFVGREAGYANTTGYSNTCIGLQSGNSMTTGNNNVCVGNSAGGANLTTNSQNTIVGATAGLGGAYSNASSFGYGASNTNGTNTIQLGNGFVTAIWIPVGATYNGSDRRIKREIKENVPGLSFIKLLKPITYRVDLHKTDKIIGYPTKVTITPAIKDSTGKIIKPEIKTVKTDTAYWEGKYDGEKIIYTGLIAQQVDSAAQTIGYNFNGVSKPKNKNEIYGLDYSRFVVPLIKAIQEQQVMIEAQQKEIEDLKKKINSK